MRSRPLWELVCPVEYSKYRKGSMTLPGPHTPGYVWMVNRSHPCLRVVTPQCHVQVEVQPHCHRTLPLPRLGLKVTTSSWAVSLLKGSCAS